MNRELERSYDTVALFVDGIRVFETVGFQAMNVNQEAQLVEQPLENGSSIIDHKIDNLTTIAFLAILPSDDYKNVYSQMESYYNKGVLFSIKTPLRFYDNAVMQGIPFQISGESPDRVELVLTFKEYRFFKTSYEALPVSNVARPGLSSTVDRGAQQGQNVNVDQSTAFRLLSGYNQ